MPLSISKFNYPSSSSVTEFAMDFLKYNFLSNAAANILTYDYLQRFFRFGKKLLWCDP